MRISAPLLAFALTVFAAVALAQPPEEGGAETAEAPEGAESESAESEADGVRTDPETGERYRLARPEEPLRRGAVRSPSWVIYLAGGVIALGAVIILVRRTRRS